ncbi:isochorismate synthase [Gryllotalpicola ginsengisoli]|uniref:isochorismate synthase n=1 Tax=Gryllotalpicola ginsengisoli TaxID=444608 RepID=UPI0003B77CEA|nr:isochorismate synthase [Gryllotalpicola ginsengisoli]
MTATATRVQALTVETSPLDDVRQLVPFLDPRNPLLWLRRGEGIAGVGEAVRLEFSGPSRIADAAAAWRELAGAATVVDRVGVPGTGLVAFGTFAFADDSTASSVLIVPRFVVGRRDGRAWLTRVTDASAGAAPAGPAPAGPAPTPFGPEFRLGFLPGELTAAGYGEAVASVVERIESGELRKAVLARDLHAHLPAGADVRRALVELALGYPGCWTFAVDGFVGASPETLVRVAGGALSAQVLAGTAARGGTAEADTGAATALAASRKDLVEHAYAVESVLTALGPHTATLSSGEPFTLKLPNLWHLATDVAGTLRDGSSSLDLVAALHPTAAVAGTPRAAALEAIAELEPFDRGRYAGPVGWIGADGSGEWAVALRSAQIDASGDITAYAGGGIVAGSDPVLEVAETTMKFRPIVEAFG